MFIYLIYFQLLNYNYIDYVVYDSCLIQLTRFALKKKRTVILTSFEESQNIISIFYNIATVKF